MESGASNLRAGADTGQRSNGLAILVLCVLIAVCEGGDVQAIGVTAAQIERAFHLSPSQMGIIFSASVFGMLPGSLIGGRLADIFGRRQVLLFSMAIFGLFSLATTQIWDYSSLVVIRFLTGVGLGGAMPNLIVLSCESVSAERRGTAVSAMYAGNPIGGALIAFVASLNGGIDAWHNVFYVGGILPIVLIPLVLAFVPARNGQSATHGAESCRTSISEALFGEGRGLTTVSVWMSITCTMIVFYFMVNWMPTLIMGRGLSHAQASMTQVCFNLGGAVGTFAVGVVLDAFSKRKVVIAVFSLIFAGLIGLANSYSMVWLLVFITLLGVTSIGAQSVIYAIAAPRYPFSGRGTGIGAAVGAARVGGVAGPAAAGQLLALGKSAAMVIGASVPVAVVAAAAILIAYRRPEERE
ncbi:3-(3-hydroxy-phenyl)propionate transporter MhpT [Paraburkholderia dipogonis]|uniref:3-(3-hydroxy-phenyl)propionate transporter MhpT n=1 Tax=Paraburkholderia dipogonis TaxID=1211383 RepID=A0A4Y8MKT6_9BURK|nr:3-(3-hydroxy-phenyl)propionate transporter MhpT [Paraburkholderia dipogonis]TFE38067.1 3-(3-hydroxy-phenyl)propionate transporter MhpT [Paraburkholderia dipogonis]